MEAHGGLVGGVIAADVAQSAVTVKGRDLDTALLLLASKADDGGPPAQAAASSLATA
jgi:hypothetical protein